MILGAIQGFGWAKMIYNAQQERSLTEAIELTFQSEQECEVCRYVSNEQKALDELHMNWLRQAFLLLFLPLPVCLLKQPSPLLLGRIASSDTCETVFGEGESPVPRSL